MLTIVSPIRNKRFQMRQYLQLGKQILADGLHSDNRTDTPSISLFGSQSRYDLTNGKIAAITTKKIHFKSIIHELLWMISGDTNVGYLRENGVTIWDEWADENGDLGPVYGAQWRKHKSFSRSGMGLKVSVIDQLAIAIDTLINNPNSRRIIVDSWSVADLPEMALPPCHMLFQFYSKPSPLAGYPRELSIQVYQRSVDYFLGLPFNLAFYSILCHMVAQVTGHTAKELIHIGGDVHIYENHVKQVELQLSREPKEETATVALNPSITSIDDFTFKDIEIVGYKSHAHIAGKVAV